MLRVLGHASRACDGVTRRDLLKAGFLTTAAGGLGKKFANANTKHSAPAKAVILIDLFGGPSHIDSFDPKPEAPEEIRGGFGTIPTAIPGIRFTEHVPLLAKRLSRFTLIRTVTHRYNSHNPYAVMTGFTGGIDNVDYHAKPTNHPSIPSVSQFFGIGRGKELPGYMMLPAFPGYSQGLRRAGPYGGYLGSSFDPVFSTCEPTWLKPLEGAKDFYDHTNFPMGDPQLPRIEGSLTADALDARRSLVAQFDTQARRFEEGSPSVGKMAESRQRAFELLLSPKARVAFDISRESPALRDRYGRDLFGSSVLMARRLVEAGVTFVTVHTEAAKGSGHWDTHSNNFKMLQHQLLPFLDRAFATLLDDLADRGLLDSTLVVVQGDMGRSPRVNKSAGRDHWPQCGFCILAGGGTKAGYVHGSSDRTAAAPADLPVGQCDLAATTYHLLGVDPEATVNDHTNRPTHISHGGRVIDGVLNS